MATIQCVTDVLDLFARSKPGTNIKDFEKTAQAWYVILEPLADEDVMEVAVTLARQEGDFMPSAGAVFSGVLDLLDPEPSADEAWVAVEARVRGKGVVPPDRALAVMQKMGDTQGWKEQDLPYRRQEFTKLYDAESKRWRQGVAAGRLALPTVDDQKLLT